MGEYTKANTLFGEFTKESGHIFLSDTYTFHGKVFRGLDFENLLLNLSKNSTIGDKLRPNSVSQSDFLGLATKKGYISLKKLKFWNCKFDSLTIKNIANGVEFKDCLIEDCLIDGTPSSGSDIGDQFIKMIDTEIKNFTIDSGSILCKLYILNNEQKSIDNFSLKEVKFHGNFKLHNCKIKKISINNVDFEKNADFYYSHFIEGTGLGNDDNSIVFKAVNFRGLALFGDTRFDEKLIFKHVTFEGHNHFKSAKMSKGLDLEYTNVQKEINFYGVEGLDTGQAIKNTSQETYRIIKHQFSKLGNTIEANRYHSFELQKREEYLKKNIFIKLSLLCDFLICLTILFFGFIA